MNTGYVIIAARKGLTEAIGNINAEFAKDDVILRSKLIDWGWLNFKITPELFKDVMDNLNKRGYAYIDADRECIKIITLKRLNRFLSFS